MNIIYSNFKKGDIIRCTSGRSVPRIYEVIDVYPNYLFVHMQFPGNTCNGSSADDHGLRFATQEEIDAYQAYKATHFTGEKEKARVEELAKIDYVEMK